MMAGTIPLRISFGFGSACSVALGNITPLTTTVVLSISVTGMKGVGNVFGLPKTKIWRFAVLVLTVKGANGVVTPMLVVIPAEGISSLISPPSTIWRRRRRPECSDCRVIGDVTRGADDEVTDVVQIGRVGRGLEAARKRRAEERRRPRSRGCGQDELETGERRDTGCSRGRRFAEPVGRDQVGGALRSVESGVPIKIGLGWPGLMRPTRETAVPAKSPEVAPVNVTDGIVDGGCPR